MAEDFPRYHEDSDDSPAESGTARRAAHRAAPEQPAPKEQEGMIFSRTDLAPSLSRPLFDFIRKQEQPEATTEQAQLPTPDMLPSVSMPDQPEVRTYQPPTEAEAIKTLHEISATDDDDEEEEAEGHGAVARAAPAPLSRPQELHRPLNEQFEEIMRNEMGEDFTRLTSQVEDEAPVATELAYAGAPPRRELRPVVPEWTPLLVPESAAEDTPEEPAPAPVGTSGSASPYMSPATPAESAAFYYNEDEPDDPTTFAYARASGGAGGRGASGSSSSAGSIPPPGSGTSASYASAGGQGGRRVGMNSLPAASFGALNPNVLPKQENHNGRWFIAGFITGWVVKQHLANKKLARFQETAQKQADQQDEKINTMAYEQQTLQRKLKRNEGQLQEVQATQTVRANQAQHPEQAAAQNQPTQAEQPAAATQAPAVFAEQRTVTPVPAGEAPLQHPGAGEAAAAGSPATGETPALRSITAEAPAQTPGTPEQTPQAAQQATAEELVAKAYELHQGEHVEHAAGGGHNIIVDKHGHEVQDAIAYGEEFQFQRRQEQVRPGVFRAGADEDAGRVAASADTQAYSMVTGLGSGPADASHSLPSGLPSPAARQRLLPSKKDNPLAATIANPWLWAALVVLLIAFFAAAFM